MLFVLIDEGRNYKLVPASKIETVEIYPDKEDKIQFSDGSSASIENIYTSLLEIKGKEVKIL